MFSWSGVVVFSLEVLWTFLCLWSVMAPTEQSPDWWRGDGGWWFIANPAAFLAVASLSILGQIVMTYVPWFVPPTSRHFGTLMTLATINRFTNFYGAYLLLSMIGAVDNLDAIRAYIVSRIEVYDVVILTAIIGFGLLTSSLADTVLDHQR
jgi:hypothetical protein